MAMAVRAMVVCSPVARSTSISGSGGCGEIWRASLMRLSVTPDMAETTTTTWCPGFLRGDDAARDIQDALRVAHRGPAIFLYDQAHAPNPRSIS